MTIRRTLISGTAAAALIFGLAGCAGPGAAVDGVLDPIFGGAAATATPTSTPTPELLAGDMDGDGKLSASEKIRLVKFAPRDYTMPDGTVIKIDPTKPLPTPVAKVIKATAAPYATIMRDNCAGGARGPALLKVMNAADAAKEATGRGVVFVYQTWNATFDSNGDTVCKVAWAAWASDNRGVVAVPSTNKAAFLASVTSWVDTRNYDIIDLD